MQTRSSNSSGSGKARQAFSLIELMTAVSIMMVIIFALYAMFNQTQKALRGNLTQVDVLESGRATADMIGRDLERLTACKLPQTINLYSGTTPVVPPRAQMDVDQNRPPLRTNVLEEIFFLSREGNKWVGTGYRVLNAPNGVGTLYRFTVSTNYHSLSYTNLMGQFNDAVPVFHPITKLVISTNFHRVADGIIHLRLLTYDPDGRRLGANTTNMHPTYSIMRLNRSGARMALSTANNFADANVVLREDRWNGTQASFAHDALPGYVELELGVLEPAALKQFQGLSDSTLVADQFLKKQAGKVHLFRQRIPIRTALQ